MFRINLPSVGPDATSAERPRERAAWNRSVCVYGNHLEHRLHLNKTDLFDLIPSI